MKICVVSGIFHPEIGGPATHLYNLCLDFVARGEEVCVLAYGETKEGSNYPFYIRRISRRDHFILRFLRFIYYVIKIGKGCDIFYVDNYGLPVAIVNLILKKPFVLRIAGDFAWEYSYRHRMTREDINEFQNGKHRFLIELIKRLQYFYARKASRIIVPSRYLKSMVEGWGIPAHKIDVVYNAVRERDFSISVSREEAKKLLGLNGKIILVVGRLVPWKGIDKLMEVLPALDKKIKFLVVGDGPDRQRLNELAALSGVRERVIFKGQIVHNKISLYLKAADVFVLPSSYEGLPHTILEAMIVGIPVVATNIGGIPEIIEDGKNGFLFKPQDLSGLGESISRLLEDSATALKFVENAKEKVKQFNWARLVGDITRILEFELIINQRNASFSHTPFNPI